MKAVIVDLLGGQAAALCADGRVVKLPDAGYALGQTVDVRERRRAPRLLRFASAAAAVLLLVGAGGGAAYAMPYGVVSLDVNPSLEYTINRFDYVLRVDGVNEDGKALLAGMDAKALVHRPIAEALEASVRQLEAGDWLGGADDEIVIAAGTKKSGHAERLVSALEDDLRRENLEVHALTVSEADIDAAHQAGMSAGRRHMLDKLRESEGAAFEPNDWTERPIQDILHRLESGTESEAENKSQIAPDTTQENARDNTEAPPPEQRQQSNDPRPATDERREPIPDAPRNNAQDANLDNAPNDPREAPQTAPRDNTPDTQPHPDAGPGSPFGGAGPGH